MLCYLVDDAKGKAKAYDEKNIRRRVYDALNVVRIMLSAV
jgi:hypothetical protein